MKQKISYCINVFTEGPGVEGKYATDLFVKRAKRIIQRSKKRRDIRGSTKPWFTYLSFQNVHSPLQVSFLFLLYIF